MATERQIERVAVIGAGNMGSGIAQKIATEGLEVRLVDLGAGAQPTWRRLARYRRTAGDRAIAECGQAGVAYPRPVSRR